MNDTNYHISWSAPEYDHREHTTDWYWAVGIVSVSLAIAFIIVGNALLSIIIILGMGTLLFYAKRVPKNNDYEFSKDGIRAEKKLYPWETLDSFWILEKESTPRGRLTPKLLLISKKVFMPLIVIPLNDSVLEEVRQSLRRMLQEVPQVEPLHDRLMRIIGF